jgi:hypothetical protein
MIVHSHSKVRDGAAGREIASQIESTKGNDDIFRETPPQYLNIPSPIAHSPGSHFTVAERLAYTSYLAGENDYSISFAE